MNVPKLFFAITAFLLVVVAPAGAAQVIVETRAVPTRAAVGDEIRLFVRVERPKAYAVEPPSDKLALAPFEVKRVEISPLETGRNRVIETFVLTLTAFETGSLTVPSFPVEYADASGKRGQLSAPPVAIRIESVVGNLTGKEDIKPIKGPLSMSLETLRAAILGSLAVLLAAVLVFLVVRRRLRRVMVDPETLKPPHERAMLELKRLRAKGWLEAGDAKSHYGELADILRRYLGRRFGLDALELTTPETVALLKRNSFSSAVLERAREVLETADLAKFAKHVPPRAAAERTAAALAEIVEMTRPTEEEAKARVPKTPKEVVR